MIEMMDNPFEPPKNKTPRDRAKPLYTVVTYCLIAMLCGALIIPSVSMSRMLTSPIPTMYLAELIIFAFIWCPPAYLTWRRIAKERRNVTSD